MHVNGKTQRGDAKHRGWRLTSVSCPYKDISGRLGVGNTGGSWQWCKPRRQWYTGGGGKILIYNVYVCPCVGYNGRAM